ncbi:MAG: DNA polymerase I [Candidatus Kaelpia aquatica]|nr:DNA polymerase I [Candidatus Kaelpia aquatica]
MNPKTIYLIDGSNYVYRAYYALPRLSNSRGLPTNAIYGFLIMLRKIMEEKNPDYIAVAFDHKKPSFRKDIYGDYKATRKPTPEDLIRQFPILKDVLRAYGITLFEIEGYEADDVLATLAKKSKREGLKSYIVSSDKDVIQAIDENIEVYEPKKDIYLDVDTIKKVYSITPNMFADFLALKGDQTDNIPGVPGIGEIAAQKLISRYGSVEELLKKIESLPDKTRELIGENKAQLLLSKKLTLLRSDVDFKIDFKAMKKTVPHYEELVPQLEKLEFNNLTKELLLAVKPLQLPKHREVKDAKELSALIKSIESESYFSFHIAERGEKRESSLLISTAKSISVIPQGLIEENREALNSIFSNSKIEKISYGIKGLSKKLKDYNIELKGPGFDVRIASYLLNPSWQKYELFKIVLNYLKNATNLSALLIESEQKGYDVLKKNIAAVYAFRELYPHLKKRIKTLGLSKLYYEIEEPLIFLLSKMEVRGINVDREYLENLLEDYNKRLSSITKDIYGIAGEKFNLNSPKQLREILYDKFNLKPVKKGKTGPSTDEESLQKLKHLHPIADHILKFRELSKIKSTYIEGLLKNISDDGKIHTSFNQAITQTGRLSCSKPNLQNIPIRSDLGKQIRAAFIPSKGYLFISADYSQIELRILAHLSGDENLIKGFKENKDIHKQTASLMFEVAEKNVTPKMRSMAKTVNFGIIYGISPYGLSKQLNSGIDESSDFIDAYFKLYPGVKKYIQREIKRARKSNSTETLFKRIRYIPEINSDIVNIREFGERIAINTPIQGSSADLIKKVMLKTQENLEREEVDARLLLQIHDELLYEVREEDLKRARSIIQDNMENALALDIPLKANISTGSSWLDLKS